MVRRELRQKYKGSALGVAWYLVNPLVLMGAYALVFKVLLDVADIPDYPLFLLAGLIVWVFFSQALLAAAPSAGAERAARAQGALPARDDPGVGGDRAARHVPGDARAAAAGRAGRARQPRPGAAAAAARGRVASSASCSGCRCSSSVLHAHFRDVEPVLAARAAAVVLPHADLPAASTTSPGSTTHELVGDLLEWANPVAPFVESVRDDRLRRATRRRRGAPRVRGRRRAWSRWPLGAFVVPPDGARPGGGRCERRRGEIVLEHATRSFALVHERPRTLKELVRVAGRGGGPRGVHALRDVSPARRRRARRSAWSGRNGAGKTSTLRCLAGIVPLDSGRAECGGRVVVAARARRRLRPGLHRAARTSG